MSALQHVSRSAASAALRTAPLVAAVLAVCGCAHAPAGTRQDTPPASAGTAGPARPVFDGARAFDVLKKQCDFGPRPVGTNAHQRTRDYLVAEMRRWTDRVDVQSFAYRGMPLTNVIGVVNPDAPRQVLLCAHWDTRPIADMELLEARRAKPILGANDGASGVAVLLELARVMKERKPAVGVVLVLFDGEDYGDFTRDEGVFLGSRHFAKNHSAYKPAYGVLLDMVGKKDLRIYREGYSDRYARAVNDKVFAAAKRAGQTATFLNTAQAGFFIQDDHIALNEAGIPTVNLIDFDYGPWHTLDDTPDKCSAASLAAVGKALVELLYSEPAR